MEADLEQKYDVIIQGTGLVECLVAGAAARIGKSVLHLDPNSCYGGQWASFSLSGLEKWVAQQQQSSSVPVEPSEEGCTPSGGGGQTVRLGAGAPVYSNLTSSWHGRNQTVSRDPPESAKDLSSAETTENIIKPSSNGECDASATLSRDALLQNSRRFNVDLAPKILYSRGEMVELLISSNVARYVEFKCITRLLCWSGDRLLSVPCSRAQVFSSKAVSLLQKRLLMKFLQFAAVYTEQLERWDDVREKAFVELLERERITGELQQYVVEGMALCSPHVTVEEGLRSLHLFLTSLGRYGASPFLATLYGSGELPQAFCRLCAVFGGTYILERSVSSVIIGTSTSAADSTADPNSTPADSKSTASEPKANDTQEKEAESQQVEVHSQSNEDSASSSCEMRDCNAGAGSSSCAVIGIMSDGRHFRCDHLVIEDRFMEAFSASATTTSSISRAVIIVERDLLQAFTVPSESATADDNLLDEDTTSTKKTSGGVALVQLQSTSGQPVTVLQFAPDTSTCSPRTWLLHLVCTGSNAEQDLAPVVQQLVDHYMRCSPVTSSAAPSEKLLADDSSYAEGTSGDHTDASVVSGTAPAAPQTSDACDAADDTKAVAASGACSADQSPAQESELALESPVVYSLYYNQVLHSGIESPYPNLYFCCGPDGALDYDTAIRQARSVFAKMYPGEEFMPRAPDPDEIIFDDPAPIEEEHCSEDPSVDHDQCSVEAQSPGENSALKNHLEKEDVE